MIKTLTLTVLMLLLVTGCAVGLHLPEGTIPSIDNIVTEGVVNA